MTETLFAIIEYMSEERFPLKHVQAIQTITHLFNWSEESEREIFEFVEHLKKKYPSVLHNKPSPSLPRQQSQKSGETPDMLSPNLW